MPLPVQSASAGVAAAQSARPMQKLGNTDRRHRRLLAGLLVAKWRAIIAAPTRGAGIGHVHAAGRLHRLRQCAKIRHIQNPGELHGGSRAENRRDGREFHDRGGRGVEHHARAGGFLGALVRAVPHADAVARPHRRRLRGTLHPGQGEHRGAAAARGAFPDSQHPDRDAGAPRRGRGPVHRPAARGDDQGAARPARPCRRTAAAVAATARRACSPRRRTLPRRLLDRRDADGRGGRDRGARAGPGRATRRSRHCAPGSPSSRPPTPGRTSWALRGGPGGRSRRRRQRVTRWRLTTPWPATSALRWRNGSN